MPKSLFKVRIPLEYKINIREIKILNIGIIVEYRLDLHQMFGWPISPQFHNSSFSLNRQF
jgi:hypothetical protein